MNVGIDLGTTNSALAYIDPQEAADADFPPIHVLSIEQQVDASRTASRRTLPSFLYVSEPPIVGAYARDQGALLPTKTVHSAKSWLSNSEADRSAKILPWDSQEEGRILSPVEASSRYLSHLRAQWERSQGTPLSDQNVVLTVPASFDEEARELTVQAARDAGIENLTLLEEPAAAFYAWIAGHLSPVPTKNCFDAQIVLVCDVGGGTSDFTLVRVDRDRRPRPIHAHHRRPPPAARRRQSGSHHFVARGIEARAKPLSLAPAQRPAPSMLRRQRERAARARHAPSSSVDVIVAGAAQSLIGGTLKTDHHARRSSRTRAGRISCLLASLSRKAAAGKAERLSRAGSCLTFPIPLSPGISRVFLEWNSPAAQHGVDAILFNGGFFIPPVFPRTRARCRGEHWFGPRVPLLFENQDLDLAVAMGAAYYSYVRASGSGVLVRGGLPRAYFLGIAGRGSGATDIKTVCLMPRGTEEGSEIKLASPSSN